MTENRLYRYGGSISVAYSFWCQLSWRFDKLCPKRQKFWNHKTWLKILLLKIVTLIAYIEVCNTKTRLQGHRTRFETFQANNFSWLNYIVFRNQWFLGSWVVEIYARSTIWYFFWSHTASAASNRNCQNSQVFWVKEG